MEPDLVWEKNINDCKEIFTKALEELNKVWEVGALEWAKVHQPGLYTMIDDLDTQLSDVWLAVGNGTMPLTKFQAHINLWLKLNLQLISLYKKAPREMSVSPGAKNIGEPSP